MYTQSDTPTLQTHPDIYITPSQRRRHSRHYLLFSLLYWVTGGAQSACVHVHLTRHADTPDTLNIGTLAPAMQTPQTLPGFGTIYRVQIYRITDTQTPPVRIFTYTPIHADTPDTSMYRYCLKTTHVQLACVHVHPTRHANTPDTLNIGTVVPAMQTPQTLPGLSTTWRVKKSRSTDTQTPPS